MPRILSLSAVASLLLVACFEPETTPLGCRGLFDCLADCFTSECEDACIARGTPEGLTRARALATCSTQNSCDTEQCLLSNCDPQLRSCAEIGPGGGAGGGGAGGSGGGTAGGSAGGAAGGAAGGSAGGAAGGSAGGAGGATCSPGVGVPELTGPVMGLKASYARGETLTATLPVDVDTRRLYVSIVEYGGTLSLGNTAENVSGSTVTVSLPAGTVAGPVGTFYLSANLCSTNDCGHPMTRNVFNQQNNGTAYTETRTVSGSPDQVCTSPIPITTFRIE